MKRKLNPFRAARVAVGLKQDEAAAKAGVSQTTISQLENGDNTNPTWDVLGRLCQLYHKRPEDLLGWPKLPHLERHHRRVAPLPLAVSA